MNIQTSFVPPWALSCNFFFILWTRNIVKWRRGKKICKGRGKSENLIHRLKLWISQSVLGFQFFFILLFVDASNIEATVAASVILSFPFGSPKSEEMRNWLREGCEIGNSKIPCASHSRHISEHGSELKIFNMPPWVGNFDYFPFHRYS